MDGELYRNRPTVEILNEQKELERLRHFSLLHGTAWWEFRYEGYAFGANKAWTDLTGYDPKKVFPSDLDPKTNPVEPKLDNLVDKLCTMVADEFKAEFKTKASDFLLWNRESKTFDYGFMLNRENDEPTAVWAIARSVWDNGRLHYIFCQVRSIDEVISPLGAGVAIAKNTEDIDRVDTHVKNITVVLEKVKTFWPLALAAFISFNNGLELAISQTIRLIDIISTPIKSAKAPEIVGDDMLPRSIDAEKLDEARIYLKEYARLGTVTLSVYEPGLFPGKFRPLAQATSRQDVLFGSGVSPISTSASPQIAAMVDAHLSGQSFEVPNGYIYSVPFTIARSDEREQSFFVEIESLNAKDAAAKQEIKDAVAQLSSTIKTLFEDA